MLVPFAAGNIRVVPLFAKDGSGVSIQIPVSPQVEGRPQHHMETPRICDPPFKESSASERWLGIEPELRGEGPEKLHGASDGFRFLLVMAAVRFGYSGERQ